MTSQLAIDSVRTNMNRLRAQLFNSIEAANLPEKQEEALKDLIRGLTYDAQANLEATLRRNGSD